MRLEILDLIHKNKSVFFGDICSAVDAAPLDIRAILANLVNEGYLYPVTGIDGPYSITNKGMEYRLKLLQKEVIQCRKATSPSAFSARCIISRPPFTSFRVLLKICSFSMAAKPIAVTIRNAVPFAEKTQSPSSVLLPHLSEGLNRFSQSLGVDVHDWTICAGV